MPQPKRQSGRGRSGRSTGGARKTSQRRSSSSARRTTSSRGRSGQRGTTRRTTGGRRRTTRPAGGADEAIRTNVQTALNRLARGVVLTRERLEQAMDDAVTRGRMTRGDANELVADLLRRGRKQTEEVLGDLEQLVGRSREQLETAATDARRRARRAPGADRVLREVDRARRSSGIAGSFPILGYDDLTANQITDRLDDLSPAELRKVRDYERRNANRKSVLSAVERKLS
jgi:polyhydroxyalkanoate synthesis regulator phasin